MITMSASRRWLILIATSIVSFMATLDASIVNIALPYIARELKVPMSTVELVTSVYM
ncbi:MAG: MFS transporter, partial [Lacticaseibacillus paracasei]|nr:MFS transporter [Lacticaseibacillus paracasei]MDN6007467.1 MFS transporter [Lacticaseibacillus paracasei]